MTEEIQKSSATKLSRHRSPILINNSVTTSTDPKKEKKSPMLTNSSVTTSNE